MESEVTKPLTFEKEALLGRLQEVKDEHENKRREAEEKATARRQDLLTAVGTLTDDQVANILSHFVGSDQDALIKWITEKVEQDKFVTIKQEPTGVETQVERWIRILNLASDKTIEVRPNEAIYAYL